MPSRRLLATLGVAVLMPLGACAAPAGEPDRASLSSGHTDEHTAGQPGGGRPPAGPETEDPEIAPEPTGGATPVGGRPWNSEVSGVCATTLREAGLGDGFTQVAQVTDTDGTTSLWTAGRRWAACDVAVADGARTSDPLLVHGQGRTQGFSVSSLRVSTARVEGPAPGTRLLAAGRLPWPVDQLSYTFPGGQTVKADFVASEGDARETWWVVAHTAADGPLADPSEQPGPVTVSVVGPAAEAFRIPWEQAVRG